jgi:hypothetical protein
MSVTERERVQVPSEPAEPLIHVYYRAPVRIGDKTLCGRVKTGPPRPDLWWSSVPTCVVCAAEKERLGWRS